MYANYDTNNWFASLGWIRNKWSAAAQYLLAAFHLQFVILVKYTQYKLQFGSLFKLNQEIYIYIYIYIYTVYNGIRMLI